MQGPPRPGSGPLEDIWLALKAWRLWTLMAWQDVTQRYRGSVIGPFWMTMSIVVIALGVGAIYSRILRVPLDEFMPHLIVGLVGWGLISGGMMEGTSSYLSAAGLIRNTAMPLPIYAFRIVTRLYIGLAHNMLAVIGVLLVVRQPITPHILLVFPGLLLLAMNTIWIVMVLGPLAARYRDVTHIVSNVVSFFMFVTPIFWFPEMAGRRHIVLVLNPFYHLLEIFRLPILGKFPSADNYGVAIMLALVGSAAAVVVLGFTRKKVVYWL